MGKGKGFAGMDAEQQRQLASLGGRTAHENGTAHEWTVEEARLAGAKGGATVSQDRAHMAAIGRAGARTRHARATKRSEAGDGLCSRMPDPAD